MKLHAITLLLSLFSASSYAIVDGTPVDWESMDDVVSGNCTGTIIAGKYVLTAAHCDKNNLVNFFTPPSSDPYAESTSQYLPDDNIHNHPDYSGSKQHDVSFWTLLEPVGTTSVHFFANLNTDPVKHDDIIKTYGFGGNNPLSYATYSIDTSDPDDVDDMLYRGNFVEEGYVTKGDSGGMWLNQNDRIVSINKAEPMLSGEYYGIGSNLSESRDFILEEINGWHYATLAKTDNNGKTTITVQSLHPSTTSNVAYIQNGNANINNETSTCVTRNNIEPFETCTYEIESQGGESSLFLGTDKNGNDEIITINKVAPQPDGGSDGSSGGSLGFFSVLGLMGLGFIRRINYDKNQNTKTTTRRV